MSFCKFTDWGTEIIEKRRAPDAVLPANAHKHYDEADTFHCEVTLDKVLWSIRPKSFHTGAIHEQAVNTTGTLFVRS